MIKSVASWVILLGIPLVGIPAADTYLGFPEVPDLPLFVHNALYIIFGGGMFWALQQD